MSLDKSKRFFNIFLIGRTEGEFNAGGIKFANFLIFAKKLLIISQMVFRSLVVVRWSVSSCVGKLLDCFLAETYSFVVFQSFCELFLFSAMFHYSKIP